MGFGTSFSKYSSFVPSNTISRTFPYGTEVEIFSFKALQKNWKESTSSYEKEHVTPYFYNHQDKFKIFNFQNKKNLSFLRWTVDKMNDLKLIQIFVTKINSRPILLDDIINLLIREPSLIRINLDDEVENTFKNIIKK